MSDKPSVVTSDKPSVVVSDKSAVTSDKPELSNEAWLYQLEVNAGRKSEEGLPSQEDFYQFVALPEWDVIKEVVDLAARSFTYDGFDPLLTGKIVMKYANNDPKMIAALVVLALEAGSIAKATKVISAESAKTLLSRFGVVERASGNSEAITLPRVVLAFPGYAFRILKSEKVNPKVVIPGWPNELSFPGSINLLTKEAQELLLDAYNMWSVVFGLTISQGTKRNKNKKVVEELNAVRAGTPVSETTWSETMQFTNLAMRKVLLKKSQKHSVCNQLVSHSSGLAKCLLAAKKRCLYNASLDISQEEVTKVQQVIYQVLSKEFESSS